MDHDREAQLQSLFEAHYPAVLAYAKRRTVDVMLAEETAAEVFVIAWRKLDRIPDDPLPWLLATARRVLANARRGQRRRERLIDRLVAVRTPRTAPDATHLVSERDEFSRAYARLNAVDREVLALVAWEGLDRERAARAMQCSKAVFAVRLHRARQRLRSQLALTSPEGTGDTPPSGALPQGGPQS